MIFFTGLPVADPDKQEDKYGLIRQAAVLSAIPGFLVVPPVVGVLLGRWLDQRFPADGAWRGRFERSSLHVREWPRTNWRGESAKVCANM